jgi:hypothetical protein
MIQVSSNADLDREAQMERERQDAYEANNTPLLQGLAKHVMDRWQDARQAKEAVLPRLRRAHRARMGEYDEAKLAHIREFGGSEEYARITANKCRIVESWLRDVFIGQTEKPWSLSPTPKPDFPPDEQEAVRRQIGREIAEVYSQTGQMPDPEAVRGSMSRYMDAVQERLKEEARMATRRMEAYMDDQLAQGGFRQALGELLTDLTVYPTAIIKGPVLRRRKRLTWVNDGHDIVPKVKDTVVEEFERVDPFRAYPAPGAASPQEAYFIQHHTLSYTDLYELIGAPGYDEEAIRAVLREGSNGGLSNWLGLVDHHNHDDLPDPIPSSLTDKVFDIDALEYHGPVKGHDLIEWGLEQDIEDPDAVYEACVWLVGSWVIKAQLNYDPLGVRPYFHSSYETLPGEFWGFGIPDILNDVQNIVNAAIRALVNNMGFSSGPQIGVNVDRLAPGEDLTTMHPLRIWQLVENQFGSQEEAIKFFQPQSNAQELLTVIEHFYQFADDFSLVPRYMAGSEQATGAGRTASGLSMLMDAANKGLKGVVSNIDTALEGLLSKLYTHNMLYADDMTIKGDAQVIARGAISLMQKETLQLRRNEFLNITANPLDSQIVGTAGRAEVLREVARDLELDVNRIVPSRDEIDQMAQQVPPPGAQAQAGAPQPGGTMSQESLENGAATTDNLSPSSMT